MVLRARATALGLGWLIAGCVALPAPARAQANPISRAAVASELHLTRDQQTHIRGIIAACRRNGIPTVATRRAVLHVLTPEQQTRLARLLPAQPTSRAAF